MLLYYILYLIQSHVLLPWIYLILSLTSLNLNRTDAFSSRADSHNNHNSFKNIRVDSVPKVDARDFDPLIHYFHSHDYHRNNEQQTIKQDMKDDKRANYHYKPSYVDYETPVLVENVFSVEMCDSICDSLVENIGDNVFVDLQRKQKISSNEIKTDIYQVTLNEAFDFMMESQHEDSFFSFCEGLLEDPIHKENIDTKVLSSKPTGKLKTATLSDIRDTLFHAREQLFSHDNENNVENCDDYESDDLFQYFPDDVKPTDCMILAGEGATSTLHRDPFEWTGTSLCLEGTKLWRFIAPPSALERTNEDVTSIDDALQSYRLPSMAWGDDTNIDDNERYEAEKSLQLSAGWQSDFSLYALRDKNKVLSARDLAFMEEKDDNEVNIDEFESSLSKKDGKQAILERTVNDLEALKPYLPSCFSDHPKFTNSDEGDGKYVIWTVVQKPGDLLVIPAHWWHQTYALEPSLAIASQRCGLVRDASRVIRHMLTTSKDYSRSVFANNDDNSSPAHEIHNLPFQLKSLLFSEKGEKELAHDRHPRNIVNELFQYLSSLKKGNL